MSRTKGTHQSFDDKGRAETPPEFSERVQEMMDQDQWQGTDRVGNVYPEPAEIVEIEPLDKTTIYKRRDGV